MLARSDSLDSHTAAVKQGIHGRPAKSKRVDVVAAERVRADGRTVAGGLALRNVRTAARVVRTCWSWRSVLAILVLFCVARYEYPGSAVHLAPRPRPANSRG